MEPTYKGYTGNDPNFLKSMDGLGESMSGYYESEAKEKELNKKNEVEKENIELRKKELQIQQDQQNTNQVIAYGGLGLASVLILTVIIVVIMKIIRSKPRGS